MPDSVRRAQPRNRRAPAGGAPQSYGRTILIRFDGRSQFLAHFHQNAAQHVLSGTVTSITPVAVIFSVLDEVGIPRRQELLAQLRVLGKLARTAVRITSSLTASQS